MECSVNERDFSRKHNRKIVINFNGDRYKGDLCELSLLECVFVHVLNN